MGSMVDFDLLIFLSTLANLIFVLFLIGPGNYYYANGACAAGYNCGTYFTARLDFVLGGGVTF